MFYITYVWLCLYKVCLWFINYSYKHQSCQWKGKNDFECWTPPLHCHFFCFQTHTQKHTHSLWQARPRQLMGPSDFTDKHTYASSETQWKSILCACFSFPLTPLFSLPRSLSAGPLLKTTECTHKHTHTCTNTQAHWLTTEAEAWWSHTNKAATRNTWCCDSTSSVTAEDIKHGCPPDNPTVMWVTVNRCSKTKFRPVYVFIESRFILMLPYQNHDHFDLGFPFCCFLCIWRVNWCSFYYKVYRVCFV